MVTETERQAIVDEEHLKLLRIGFFVSAAESGFYSLFGLLYVGFGAFAAAMAKQAPKHPEQPPPELFLIFGVFGGGFFLAFLTMGVLKLYVAKCIRLRQSRTFCLVVSLLTAPGLPYGTILGGCGLAVLTRASVKALFERPLGAPPPIVTT